MVRLLGVCRPCNGNVSVVLTFLTVVLVMHLCLKLLEIDYARKNNCTFEPIDVVYTWVNGSDQLFIEAMAEYLKDEKGNVDSSRQRFDDKHELRFSLRSLEKYAPWINHVYLLTNGQIPYWLDLDYDKLTIVTHEMIFRSNANLPTFSSPAIESNLHRIPGLSKHFIYFNDDIFLGQQLYPEDFYTPNKGYSIFLAYPLPGCSNNCPWLYVGDGQCDAHCNVAKCQFDGGDCDKSKENPTESTYNHQLLKGRGNVNATNITLLVEEHNRGVLIRNKRKTRTRRREGKYNHPSKAIDGFLESLLRTQRLFNEKYGFRPRYVPAHAPIFLDKDVLQRLEDTFPVEFELTERNRFRRDDDVQFAFSYYYFLMSETVEKPIGVIFDEFDTDRSETWSDREIRNVLAKIYELPLSYEVVDHFEGILVNCSELRRYPEVRTPPYERYIDSKLPTVSKQMITECPFLRDYLKKKFGHVPKYKHETIKNAETNRYATFRMLTSNVTDAVIKLDEVRNRMTKFICLNDNLDWTKPAENELIRAILYDFYVSQFPRPSRFELPERSRNRFLHVEELRAWKRRHLLANSLLLIVIVSLVVVTFFNVIKKACCLVFGKLLHK